MALGEILRVGLEGLNGEPVGRRVAHELSVEITRILGTRGAKVFVWSGS